MTNVLITGSNRGVGLELTRQCLEQGQRVFATCRQPEQATALQALKEQHGERLTIFALDVADVDSIKTAVSQIQQHTSQIDLLLNNAGILNRGESISNLDTDILARAFQVNAIGPMVVIQQALGLLQASPQARIVNVTSQLGSILKLTEQDWGSYSYNASKAALNVLTLKLVHECPEMISIVIHPGWVQTDMGGSQAAITAETSAAGILSVAAGLTTADNGRFYIYNGESHPW
ncbi:MAG: SDR family oxidoreductase [Chloroflexota bacterium]